MVFCDADVYPKDDLWLRTICNQVCEPNVVMTRPHWKRGGCGICAVKTEVFHSIRGFDEAMIGWGYEDIDFRGRMEQVGQVVSYDARMIGVLKHGTDNRVQFYPDKNAQASNNRNKRLSVSRKGLVNPKGFGICRAEFIRP
jgi:GT2 family glycosyltransferase